MSWSLGELGSERDNCDIPRVLSRSRNESNKMSGLSMSA